MADLKTAILLSKKRKPVEGSTMQDIVEQLVAQVLPGMLKEAYAQMQGSLDEAVKKHADERFTKALKGEPGYTPVKNKDYFDGKAADEPDFDKIVEAVVEKVPKPKNGRPPTTQELKAVLLPLIPEPLVGDKGAKGKDGSPDTPEQVVEKIHKSKKKIKIEAIEGLDKAFSTVNKGLREVARANGNSGRLPSKMEHGGGMTLRAGANITLTRNSDGTYTVASTGGGGGGSGLIPLMAAGVVNGINTSFIFGQEPDFILSDGVWYAITDNNGNAQWTWNAGTMTATMVVPPTTSILGFGAAALTLLTATGTVNGINKNFVFTTEPTYVVSDGVWYESIDNNGNTQWVWNAGTLTVTMVVPPTTSIYGF